MTRPSAKRLRKLISEEKRSSKAYRQMGFPKIAKDETRHSRFLQKQLSKSKKH